MPSDPLSILVAASEEAPPWTDTWQAWGSVVAAGAALLTLAAAIAAAVVAWGQLKEARRVRREQAQAYVVVYARSLERISQHFVELVIENLGSTVARNVAVTSTPSLTRTNGTGGTQDVALPAAIPVLAPRQQWRTFLDSTAERHSTGQPLSRHDIRVTYEDTFGETHEEMFVLDWAFFSERMFATEKTVHHAAKSLGEITRILEQRMKP
ncbi:hypothetical protein [Geodermatophilus sp. SYSU D01119]